MHQLGSLAHFQWPMGNGNKMNPPRTYMFQTDLHWAQPRRFQSCTLVTSPCGRISTTLRSYLGVGLCHPIHRHLGDPPEVSYPHFLHSAEHIWGETLIHHLQQNKIRVSWSHNLEESRISTLLVQLAPLPSQVFPDRLSQLVTPQVRVALNGKTTASTKRLPLPFKRCPGHCNVHI